MALEITDREIDFEADNTAVGVGEHHEVTARVGVAPFYVLVEDKWLLDQKGTRTVVPDYATGEFSLSLPSADESLPSDPLWTITRSNGVSVTGHVPNIDGPVSVYDLVHDYDWVLVPVPVEPYLAVTTTTDAPTLGTADSLPDKPSGYYQTTLNQKLVWIPYWES